MKQRSFQLMFILIGMLSILSLGMHTFAEAGFVELTGAGVIPDETMWYADTTSSPYLDCSEAVEIDVTSSDNGWTTACGNVLYRYDGAAWSQVRVDTADIFTIDMLTAEDGWMAGHYIPYGTGGGFGIWHYDGAGWQTVPSPIDEVGYFLRTWMYSLRMSSPTEGWLSGPQPLHYNGLDWETADTGLDGANLSVVDGVASGEAWGLGGPVSSWSSDVDDYYIYHYDGSTWVTVTEAFAVDLNALDMLALNDGWAVGDEGAIFHYTGGPWVSVTSPTDEDLIDVQFLAPDDGWAISSNSVLYYDGNVWAVIDRIDDIQSFSMVSGEDGWLRSGAILYHYEGVSWKPVHQLDLPGTPLYDNSTDVVTVSSDDAFVLSGRLARYEEGAWQFVTSTPATGIEAIDAVGANSIWVVGTDNKLYHGVGSVWVETDLPGTTLPTILDARSDTDVWVAGDALYYYDGASWDTIVLPNEASYGVLDFNVTNASSIWVVGNSSTGTSILHYNGSEWQASANYASSLSSADLVSATLLWGLHHDMPVRYNGATWDTYDIDSLFANEDLTWLDMHSITGATVDSAWIVGRAGGGGVVLSFDGASWLQAAWTTGTMRDIGLWGDAVNLAVGRTILRAVPAGPYTITGTVTDDTGEPVFGALVATEWGHRGTTDMQGHYVLTDVPTGTLTVTPYSTAYAFSPISRSVTLPPAQIGVDFGAVHSGISGQVANESSAGLAGIVVQAYKPEGTGYTHAASAKTAGTGAYRLDMAPGTYRLYFSDPAQGYRSQYYDGAPNLASADDITVVTHTVTKDIDAVLFPAASPLIGVAGAAASSADLDTGEVTVIAGSGGGVVTFTRAITCPIGVVPSDVELSVGTKAFQMAAGEGDIYTVAIDLWIDLAGVTEPYTLTTQYVCTAPVSEAVGQVVLHDPSGRVLDTDGQAVMGAVVSLYKAPGEPDSDGVTRDCRTVETRPGGVTGSWDALPAADVELGVLATSAWAAEAAVLQGSPVISPTANPQMTGDDGRYAWDVSEGCWYVAVKAEGYEPTVSPLVGVPPLVTDLDVTLTLLPTTRYVYLPLVLR